MSASGTVTFLFTDIEGSTRLLQQLGEDWPPMLERHRALIRAAVAAQDGEELSTEGDSFFVAFGRATGAVAAAADAQRALTSEAWAGGEPLRVRMGLHTGEGQRDATGDFSGIDVHRAARIAAAGHGGQVLISDATRVLVEASLPAGVTLRDLGAHQLKDLSNPERLWQLVIDGLESDFPTLTTLDATPNNLPVQLTTFLGREHDIGEVGALIERQRLVTLTGPGGTGKTRLSLQVAARMGERFPDGIRFVPLSTVSDPKMVAATIAHALGLPDSGGRMPEDRIVDHLAAKRVLLVLDNFEQLVAAAPLVSRLLTRTPGLSVLATSREPLHLYGEHEYAVPPLGVPPLDGSGGQRLPDLASLSQYESVALFIERARAVKPEFAVTNQNAPAVAEICVRLDGLPLAIELAAARIRILPPQAILHRLVDRLDLLSGGGGDRPERQQTLRGAIAWSYDMLDELDRRLFASLAVLTGGGSLDAIEAVSGPIIDGDVLDGLSSLVDKSLVRQRIVDDEPRFSQLLTIREFAVEKAAELGLLDEARQRHAAYFERFSADAQGRVMGSDKRLWLDRLDLEHDNLRAALRHSAEIADARAALEISANLWRFWQMRGHLDEGLDHVRRALALPSDDDAASARLRALEAAGGLAYWQADLASAEGYYQEVLDAQRAAGNEAGTAQALYNLSFVYSIPTAGTTADPARTVELVSEAVEIYRRLDDRAGLARTLWSLSNGSWSANDTEASERYSLEALDIFRELDDRFMLGWTLYTIGMIRIQDGRPGEAAAPLREALASFAEANDVSGYVLVLDGLAAEAFVLGDLPRAARLAAAVSVLQRSSGTGLTPGNRELIGFSHEPLQANPDLAEAWAEGERMTTDEAVAYALEPVPSGVIEA
jgi:predicted ATPase/class 3 adenylate cyclase